MNDQSRSQTDQWDLGDLVIFSLLIMMMLVAPVIVAVEIDLTLGILLGSGFLWWILGYESGLIPRWKREVMDRV